MAGFFDTLFGGGAEREAADRNRAASNQYGTDAQGYLTTGYNTGVGNLDKAVGAYQPLQDLGAKYNMGGDLWRDSLGINGAAGNARASGSFVNGPGYEKGVDAALGGINRRRALGGMVDSGNADIDALNYAQNSQNQQWGNWQQQLQQSGATGAALTGTAAAGQAAGYGALSDLAQNYAHGQTGVAGNVTSGLIDASKLQAQGEASGAKNLLNFGMQGLTALAGIPGLGSGVSSMIGSSGLGSALGIGQGPITYGSAAGPTRFS